MTTPTETTHIINTRDAIAAYRRNGDPVPDNLKRDPSCLAPYLVIVLGGLTGWAIIGKLFRLI